jgi:hypothetical protein
MDFEVSANVAGLCRRVLVAVRHISDIKIGILNALFT